MHAFIPAICSIHHSLCRIHTKCMYIHSRSTLITLIYNFHRSAQPAIIIRGAMRRRRAHHSVCLRLSIKCTENLFTYSQQPYAHVLGCTRAHIYSRFHITYVLDIYNISLPHIRTISRMCTPFQLAFLLRNFIPRDASATLICRYAHKHFSPHTDTQTNTHTPATRHITHALKLPKRKPR